MSTARLLLQTVAASVLKDGVAPSIRGFNRPSVMLGDTLNPCDKDVAHTHRKIILAGG